MIHIALQLQYYKKVGLIKLRERVSFCSRCLINAALQVESHFCLEEIQPFHYILKVQLPLHVLVECVCTETRRLGFTSNPVASQILNLATIDFLLVLVTLPYHQWDINFHKGARESSFGMKRLQLSSSKPTFLGKAKHCEDNVAEKFKWHSQEKKTQKTESEEDEGLCAEVTATAEKQS